MVKMTNNNHKQRPEYSTVVNHYHMIFNPKYPNHHNYVGMPFCDEWNPDKGGSYMAGMLWILENLGSKPSPQHSLDVIEHQKGFVPKNLRWALRRTQKSNQRHRTMFLLTPEQHATAMMEYGRLHPDELWGMLESFSSP